MQQGKSPTIPQLFRWYTALCASYAHYHRHSIAHPAFQCWCVFDHEVQVTSINAQQFINHRARQRWIHLLEPLRHPLVVVIPLHSTNNDYQSVNAPGIILHMHALKSHCTTYQPADVHACPPPTWLYAYMGPRHGQWHMSILPEDGLALPLASFSRSLAAELLSPQLTCVSVQQNLQAAEHADVSQATCPAWLSPLVHRAQAEVQLPTKTKCLIVINQHLVGA